MNENEKVCLIPGCGREAKCRGLCHLCYQAATKRVQRGTTTWDWLVEHGLALDAKRPTRGYFASAFRNANESQFTEAMKQAEKEP